MKKILSMMLAVMLVLSSFVMVSADGEFSVIEVNNTSKEHNLETPLETGYYRVSVDVYLTEGTAASVAANNGTYDVASADATVAAVDVWQTVSLEVKNAAITKLVLTATGGKAYFNNIKIDQLYSATLVYEENFEGTEGEKVKDYDLRSCNDNWKYVYEKAAPETSFTYQSFDGKTVGALDYPKSINASAVRYDENGTKLETQAYADPGDKYELYSIDIEKIKDSDHIYIEFDLYNAATAWNEKVDTDPAGYNLIKNRALVNDTFIVGAYPSFEYCRPGEASAAQASFAAVGFEVSASTGLNDNVDNYIAHKNPVHAWNKVTYEIRREGSGATQKIYQKVSYGDTQLEGELINAWEVFNSFRKITFHVDANYGGKFYIDNLKVYDLSEIVTDGYVTRYSEDFDNANYKIGQEVPELNKYAVDASAQEHLDYATFTVEKDTNLANITSNYGRLYNSRYQNDSYNHFKDDGVTEDTNAEKISDSTNYIAFKKEIMEPGWGVSKVGDTKKTKISFKYYIPGTVMPKDTSDKTPREYVEVMLRPQGNNRLWNYDAFYTRAACGSPSKLFINGDGNVGAVIDGAWEVKNWVSAEYEITSTLTDKENNLYTHVITYKLNGNEENDMYVIDVGGGQSQATFTGAKDLNTLHLCLGGYMGGSMFLDDIKVETSFIDSDYDALNKIASPVYSKNAKVDGLNELYTINSASFAADAQSVNMTISPYAPEKVQIVTAMFKDGVLDSAKINEFNITTETAFVPFDFNLSEKITLPDEISGETFKVFVIDSVDGLKPLADMFTK